MWGGMFVALDWENDITESGATIRQGTHTHTELTTDPPESHKPGHLGPALELNTSTENQQSTLCFPKPTHRSTRHLIRLY